MRDRPLPPSSTDPVLLTVSDVARLLRLSVRTVWRRTATGELPRPIHVGKAARWLRSEIVTWAEGNRLRRK